MDLIKKSITVTSNNDAWVKARMQGGDFATDSEYFRHLIRRDQEENAQFQALKTAIQEGLDSGVSTRNVTDIMQDVEERLRADGQL